MENHRFVLIMTLGAFLFSACGGAEQKTETPSPVDTDAVEATTAQQQDGGPTAPAVPAESEAVSPAKAPSGPGTMTIKLFAGKKEAEGLITVLTYEADPKTVVEDQPSSRPIEVPAGEYFVKATFTTAVDHPVLELREVKVEPGEDLVREIKFPVGEVTLQTFRGGSQIKTKVKLRRQVETKRSSETKDEPWFETLAPTHEPVLISPGVYECEVQLGGKKGFRIKGITVYDGGIHKIPLKVP